MQKTKAAELPKRAISPEKLRRYLPAVVTGVNIVLLFTNVLILSLLPNQVEKSIIARSEILAHQLQLQNTQKLVVDLENTQKEQARIHQSLPTKERLLEVIELLESLKEVTQVKSFTFAGDVPRKDTAGLSFLPLTLTLEGSLQQTMAALVRLSRSPYLLTVEHTVMESPGGVSQTINVKVFMRLYVKEQFAEN